MYTFVGFFVPNNISWKFIFVIQARCFYYLSVLKYSLKVDWKWNIVFSIRVWIINYLFIINIKNNMFNTCSTSNFFYF